MIKKIFLNLFSFSLTKRYVPAVILIAIFIMIHGVLTSQMISSGEEYGKIINVSGKQRMLSQRLVILALNYYDNKDIKENRIAFVDALGEIRDAHKYLLSKQFNHELKDIYVKKGLDENLKIYLGYFNKVLRTGDKKYIVDAQKNSKWILIQLDSAVKEYERFSSSQLKMMQKYEQYLVLITLLLLIFIAVYILKPAANKIDSYTHILKNEEEYKKTVIESNNNAIIAIDWTAKITTYNKKAEELFGWTKEEMINTRNLTRIIPLKYKDLHTNASQKYLSSGESCGVIDGTHELEGLRKDGTIFPLNISFGAKWKIKNAIVVASIIDISIQKEQENQLIQSEKLASLGGMVAGIAHEINTPVGMALTGITHLEEEIDLLEKNYDDDEMTDESFKEYIADTKELNRSIHINLKKAAALVRSFKQVAVDQSSDEDREFYLNEYVEEILLSLHNKIKKLNHKVEVYIDDSIKLNSNPGLFAQIITNFVMNSIIHGFMGDSRGIIVIEAEKLDDKLLLVYKDNGKGLSKEVKKKIFDPFFTTNRDNGGSGLGMNIVYNIVSRQLKGEIDIISEIDGGLEYRITIPNILI